ncbi:hypothetical protein CYB_2720 [Synechococcus sp. JA-2-3B'a(2-13)]|nr:hypothetical protein CYB_2720 [Synechococcus sp. JA-2-3B'a(2-13)]
MGAFTLTQLQQGQEKVEGLTPKTQPAGIPSIPSSG